jgi:hypothetical protein
MSMIALDEQNKYVFIFAQLFATFLRAAICAPQIAPLLFVQRLGNLI